MFLKKEKKTVFTSQSTDSYSFVTYAILTTSNVSVENLKFERFFLVNQRVVLLLQKLFRFCFLIDIDFHA